MDAAADGDTEQMEKSRANAGAPDVDKDESHARTARGADVDRTALYTELLEIKDLAKQYLAFAKQEEQTIEASHAILRVVLQQLQSREVSHLAAGPSSEDAHVVDDINQLVTVSQGDSTALVQVIEGITSEAQFCEMHDVSV